MIAPALDETLGQRSAHSLATGPEIPEPFISPLGVDDDSSVILAANKDSIRSSPSFPLSNDNSRMNLLSQLLLSFLDCDQDHIAY